MVDLVYQSLRALPKGAIPEAVITPLGTASQRATRFNLALVTAI
ncbi:MAG: hypothetical protein ACOYMP_12290 [Nodosilinea sp.]